MIIEQYEVSCIPCQRWNSQEEGNPLIGRGEGYQSNGRVGAGGANTVKMLNRGRTVSKQALPVH